jgi:hypothetical protein
MAEASQLIGAMFILVAYILAQAKMLDQGSYTYLVLNVAGSAVLAILALEGQEWGFLLLEGSWATVTAVGLGHRMSCEYRKPGHTLQTGHLRDESIESVR